MSNHASESSLPVLSHADGFAASASDALLLVGRVLLGWLFLTSAWGKFMNMGGYVAYLRYAPRFVEGWTSQMDRPPPTGVFMLPRQCDGVMSDSGATGIWIG